MGNRLKRQWQTTVGWAIAAAGLKNRRFERPVIIRYSFYEPNRKRDKSNIGAFAIKVIEDSMQDMGVIKNDNWAGVAGFEECFFVDKDNPRIEVEIWEETEQERKEREELVIAREKAEMESEDRLYDKLYWGEEALEEDIANTVAYQKGYDNGYVHGWNEAKLEP